nr:MAG: hypothetical protein JST_6450 [Candidatus Parcubacteria bacterium]
MLIFCSFAFLLALADALPAYIRSSYMESFVGVSAVSWFYIAANLVAIIAILIFPKVIKRLSNYLSAGLMLAFFIFSLLGLGLSNTALGVFIFFIVMQVSSYLLWINLDIFLESNSDDQTTGRTRTIYLTFMNLAWVFAPSISAWLVEARGYEITFLISSLVMIPFLIIYLTNREKLKNTAVDAAHTPLKTAFKETFRNKNLRAIYVVAGQLSIFLNAAVVFLPIHLNQNLGFTWNELSIAFSIMLLPFLIVEIPAGILADKHIGEKELLTFGFLIIIASLAVFFTSTSTNIWFWTAILFTSRVGVALIEAMRESYFFKNVDAHDIEKINIFRTAAPLGYVVASLIALITLMFLPLEYIFIVIALFICLFTFPALISMKDSL